MLIVMDGRLTVKVRKDLAQLVFQIVKRLIDCSGPVGSVTVCGDVRQSAPRKIKHEMASIGGGILRSAYCFL